jgi:hypothetical protein
MLRAILDEGLRSSVQWNGAILLAESYKLDPQCFNEGPRPKSHKWRLNLHGTILEEKQLVQTHKKKLN